MDRNFGKTKLSTALGAICAVSALVTVGLSEGSAAQQSNFMGGAPEVLELGDVRTLRLRFPAGVRSNWHTHSDGQLLMLESGRGLTQVRRAGPPRDAGGRAVVDRGRHRALAWGTSR